MNFRKQFLLSLTLLITPSLIAQQNSVKKELSVANELCVLIASGIKIPVLTPPPPPPSKWKGGTLFQLGFSQLSLTNWASGGYDNIALNAFVNVYRNYSVNKEMFWENRLQVALLKHCKPAPSAAD